MFRLPPASGGLYTQGVLENLDALSQFAVFAPVQLHVSSSNTNTPSSQICRYSMWLHVSSHRSEDGVVEQPCLDLAQRGLMQDTT